MRQRRHHARAAQAKRDVRHTRHRVTYVRNVMQVISWQAADVRSAMRAHMRQPDRASARRAKITSGVRQDQAAVRRTRQRTAQRNLRRATPVQVVTQATDIRTAYVRRA